MDLLRVVAFLGAAGLFCRGVRRFVARNAPGSPSEVALASVITGSVVALGMMRVLGLLGLITPVPLVVAPALLGLGLGWRGPVPRARNAGGWPWTRSMLGSAGLALTVVTCAALLIQAWLYRSTAWDALWYHVLMTHSYVLNASTEWLEVGVPYASGYPNAVELLTAWPCAVLGTTSFDDVGQIPFGVGAVSLVSAWSRRAGASSGAAVAFGAAWLLVPPVFLQLTSNLNDVAEALGLSATIYYLWVAPESKLRSWLVLMSAALAFAAKGTGIVLLAPLAPLLVRDQLRGARKGTVMIQLGARSAVLFGVGLYKQVENWIHTENPFWPMRTSVLGHRFDGPIDPSALRWGGIQGLDSFAFSGEGDFERMLRSWYDLSPGYEPNVLSGGFGVVHAFLGVPAIVAAVLWLPTRSRDPARWPLAAALLLFVLALMAPVPWWPRFVLAASIASMTILAGMSSRLPAWLPEGVGWLAITASVVMFPAVVQGIHSYGEHGITAVLELPAAERARIPLGALWPAAPLAVRDMTFGPDDALAYGSEVQLVGQFVPWRYGSRLAWVEPTGTDADYLARLRAARARWVVGGPVARARLDRLGATELYRHGEEAIFEVPAP